MGLRRIGSWLICLLAFPVAQARSAESPPLLVSAKVAHAPTLDGVGSDAGWRTAAPLQVQAKRPLPPDKGAAVLVEIRSVHTDSDVYFLVTWADATESVSHKTWIWTDSYEQGDDREDMFSLAFEHTGPFDADMLSGTEAVWDVWHWKALRTNPQGYATDKTHHYTRAKPQGKAKSHEARNGEDVWIARPEDAGDSVEKKQPAPAAFAGERVVQYLPGQPSDSAADVRAKGAWSDGAWTLELSRRLDTGHPDDTTFELGSRYKMALAVFDHTGDMDKASDVMELWLAPSTVSDDFEGHRTDSAPLRFRTALTGRGEVGQWMIREAVDAASGGKVLMQVSDDPTNYRLPLLVYDYITARDVDVSIHFKPISGSVDQSGGIVWRYRDEDNYYVVRANALEDNVVLYKVEHGRRSDLKPKGSWFGYGRAAEVQRGIWSVLRVRAQGSHFDVWLDDEHLFQVEDTTFSEPGRVGLWTKADSVTAFDDLSIKSIDAE